MLNKDELKNKLDEIKNLIKENSKDANQSENLVNELLSVYDKYNSEETLVHIPLSSIEKECDGETFTMSITKDGQAIYHTRGGYTVIADERYSSFFDTIYNLIDYINGSVKLDEEMNTIMDGDVIATSYVLNIPIYAMGDYSFKVELFNRAYEYLSKALEDASAELKDETFQENKEFQDAIIALQALKIE